jgi:hypothetical protein
LMWLLEWLSRSAAPAPRSYDAIRADLEAREAPALQRLTRVEESLLSLTAEAGLIDLQRRLEAARRA